MSYIAARFRRLALTAACLVAAALLSAEANAQSQQGTRRTFTLNQAIEYALQNYPAVRASLQQLSAAHAQVSLARTAYLPQFNGVYQDSRATQNQVPGIWLPTSITPAVEGPVGASSGQSYWGSQTAALFSWEAIDFGLRGSQVGEARSAESKSTADLAVTRLEVAAEVGNYYLATLSARLAVTAAQANVDRWQVFDKAVHALVDNTLRPGVDASRADAQLAFAKVQLYQTQEQEQTALATLAALMGVAGAEIDLDAGPLLSLPSDQTMPNLAPAEHPVAHDQMTVIRQAQAQQEVLNKTDYPRIFLQAEGFARGSEVPNNGSAIGNWNGLAPGRGNWVAGLTVTFPNVFDFKALSAKKQMAKANELAQQAIYDKTVQDLSGRVHAARAQLKAANLVAEQTPIELKAAQAAETQSRARYESSLATIVEVADAEGLLARAQADDTIARINVWCGLFGLAYAQGDLQPFLKLLEARYP